MQQVLFQPFVGYVGVSIWVKYYETGCKAIFNQSILDHLIPNKTTKSNYKNGEVGMFVDVEISSV